MSNGCFDFNSANSFNNKKYFSSHKFFVLVLFTKESILFSKLNINIETLSKCFGKIFDEIRNKKTPIKKYIKILLLNID
jgi:hypothetical protein